MLAAINSPLPLGTAVLPALPAVQQSVVQPIVQASQREEDKEYKISKRALQVLKANLEVEMKEVDEPPPYLTMDKFDEIMEKIFPTGFKFIHTAFDKLLHDLRSYSRLNREVIDKYLKEASDDEKQKCLTVLKHDFTVSSILETTCMRMRPYVAAMPISRHLVMPQLVGRRPYDMACFTFIAFCTRGYSNSAVMAFSAYENGEKRIALKRYAFVLLNVNYEQLQPIMCREWRNPMGFLKTLKEIDPNIIIVDRFLDMKCQLKDMDEKKLEEALQGLKFSPLTEFGCHFSRIKSKTAVLEAQELKQYIGDLIKKDPDIAKTRRFPDVKFLDGIIKEFSRAAFSKATLSPNEAV